MYNHICKQCEKQFIARKDQQFCSALCHQLLVKNPENMLISLKERFNKKVIKNKNECWGWKGYIGKNPYPQMLYKKPKRVLIHRVSWLIHKGPVPNGLFVLHKCDNKICTNPDHLFLGTIKDNSDDMISKGRQVILRGESIGTSKLKELQVIDILNMLKDKRTISEISRIFYVSRKLIREIRDNKSWKHIERG